MMIRQPILSVSTLLAAILIVGCSGGEHHGPGSGHAGVRETIAMHESDTQHARAMTDRWTDRIARRPVAGLDLAGRDTF